MESKDLVRYVNENYHSGEMPLAEIEELPFIKLFIKLIGANSLDLIISLILEFLKNPNYYGLCGEVPYVIEKFLETNKELIDGISVPPTPIEGAYALNDYIDQLMTKNKTKQVLMLLKTLLIQVYAYNSNIPISTLGIDDRDAKCDEMSEDEDHCDVVLYAYIEVLREFPQPIDVVEKTLEIISSKCPLTLEDIDKVLEANKQGQDTNPENNTPEIPIDDIKDTLDQIDKDIDEELTIPNKTEIVDLIHEVVDGITGELKEGLTQQQQDDLDKISIIIKEHTTANTLYNYEQSCKDKAKSLKNKWMSLLTKIDDYELPINLDLSAIGKFFKCIIK